MKIIEIDTDKFNSFRSDYKDFNTKNDKFAEHRMLEWFRYLNFPRETTVYKFNTGHSIKWMVMV